MILENELYNQRQLRLMLKKIDFYEKGELSLKHMISDVEALAYTLLDIEDTWKSRVSGFEGNIDYCNLNWHDKSLSIEIRKESKIDLDRLIKALKEHIESKIDKNLTDKDVEYKY